MRQAHRNTDPVTSVIAARKITRSGRRQTLCDICFDCLSENPGLTAGEVGDKTGLGHLRVWRRLSDLKNQGWIKQGEPKKWEGSMQVTWWLDTKNVPKPAQGNLFEDEQ